MSTHHHDPAYAQAQQIAVEIKAKTTAGQLPKLTEITAAIERENRMRRKVYPGRMQKGHLSVGKAAAEILAMERAGEFIVAAFQFIEGRDKSGDIEAAEILQKFGRIEAPEADQPSLF